MHLFLPFSFRYIGMHEVKEVGGEVSCPGGCSRQWSPTPLLF